jgi:enoyl-CoA hydratase
MISKTESFGPIVVRTFGRSVIFVFDRPEIRNPLSTELIETVENLLNRDDIIRSSDRLIFTGKNGVFASGANLKEIAEVNAKEASAFARRGQNLMKRISSLAIPTAAAIDGYCFGGALDLALACDSRVATEGSTFCHPGAGLGIITGWGGTQRLPRLIGETNALYILFTATPIPAAEALRIGLIDKIADDPLASLINS